MRYSEPGGGVAVAIVASGAPGRSPWVVSLLDVCHYSRNRLATGLAVWLIRFLLVASWLGWLFCGVVQVSLTIPLGIMLRRLSAEFYCLCWDWLLVWFAILAKVWTKISRSLQ